MKVLAILLLVAAGAYGQITQGGTGGGGGGGSGTVNIGTNNGCLAYYPSNTAAVSCVGPDYIFNTHTLTLAATAVFDAAANSAIVNLPASFNIGGNAFSTAAPLTFSGAFSTTFTFGGAATFTMPTTSQTIPGLGQANTWSSGLQDFASANIRVPASAGFVSTVFNTIGRDTTPSLVHMWANSADALIPYFPTASLPTSGHCVQWGSNLSLTDQGSACATGTVTTFSAGTLSPLFTTSVATATTTPALTFTLSNFSADNIFGNFTGGSAAPSTQAIPSCANDGAHALVYVAHVLTCETVTASGFANPMTTLGDIMYENATPAAARLAGPTTPASVPEILTSTPNGSSVAQAPAWGLPGVVINAQSGATYTVATTDRVGLVQTTNNTTSTAVSVPQAGTSGFANSLAFVHCNTGTVVATDTPTTSTVDGNATIKLLGFVAGGTPECAFWWSDNTNYWAATILPVDANGLLQLGAESANTVTAAANFTSGNLVKAAASNKTTSDSGVAASTVVTTTGQNPLGASVNVLATNSSSQAIAATAHNVSLVLDCPDTSSSSTAYVCTPTPSTGALSNGDIIILKSPNQNNASGAVTLNVGGSGAKPIKKWQGNAGANLAAGDIQSGEPSVLAYDGAIFLLQTIGNAPAGGGSDQFTNLQTFSSNGTWTAPSGTYSSIYVVCYGSGGGGGSGNSGAAGTARGGGAGGGGGVLVTRLFRFSDITSPVTVTVDGGGAGGTAGASGAAGNAGSPGGNTTFGTYLTCYGGGGGSGGSTAAQTSGSGAGSGGAGTTGSNSNIAGGPPCLGGGNCATNQNGVGNGGAGVATGAHGWPSEYGGASGGGSATSAGGLAGGTSLFGGPGGGGGATTAAANTTGTAGAGGNQGTWVTTGGGGGAGGASGASGSTGTGGAAGGCSFAGTGGGGGGSSTTAGNSGLAGGAGGAPAGGGGGGGSGTTGSGSPVGGVGGAGGAGLVCVYSW